MNHCCSGCFISEPEGEKGILNELQKQVEAQKASRGHEVSDLVNKVNNNFVFLPSVDELTVLDS